MQSASKAALAEVVGTFALCFVGAGAIVTAHVVNAAPGVDLLMIAAAHGLVLSIMVSALGSISGGHFNPAVTFGLWIAGKMDAPKAAMYVLAQLIGATVAGFFVRGIYPADAYAAVNGGTPGLALSVSYGTGVVVEAVLTFFLVLAVMGTAVSAKAPKVGGFAIGLTLFFDILVGGPLTGASMNPARTFGPGLAAGFWSAHWVYWVGPLLGGGIAAFVYERFFGTEPDA